MSILNLKRTFGVSANLSGQDNPEVTLELTVDQLQKIHGCLLFVCLSNEKSKSDKEEWYAVKNLEESTRVLADAALKAKGIIDSCFGWQMR